MNTLPKMPGIPKMPGKGSPNPVGAEQEQESEEQESEPKTKSNPSAEMVTNIGSMSLKDMMSNVKNLNLTDMKKMIGNLGKFTQVGYELLQNQDKQSAVQISDTIATDIESNEKDVEKFGKGLFKQLIEGFDEEEFKAKIGPMIEQELTNMYDKNDVFQNTLANLWILALRTRTYPIYEQVLGTASEMKLPEMKVNITKKSHTDFVTEDASPDFSDETLAFSNKFLQYPPHPESKELVIAMPKVKTGPSFKSLDSFMTQDDVLNAFPGAVSVDMPAGKSFAYVTFDTHESAEAAFNNANKQTASEILSRKEDEDAGEAHGLENEQEELVVGKNGELSEEEDDDPELGPEGESELGSEGESEDKENPKDQIGKLKNDGITINGVELKVGWAADKQLKQFYSNGKRAQNDRKRNARWSTDTNDDDDVEVEERGGQGQGQGKNALSVGKNALSVGKNALQKGGTMSNEQRYNAFIYYKREFLKSLSNKHTWFNSASMNKLVELQKSLLTKLVGHYAVIPREKLVGNLSEKITGKQFYTDIESIDDCADDSIIGLFMNWVEELASPTIDLIDVDVLEDDWNEEESEDEVDVKADEPVTENKPVTPAAVPSKKVVAPVISTSTAVGVTTNTDSDKDDKDQSFKQTVKTNVEEMNDNKLVNNGSNYGSNNNNKSDITGTNNNSEYLVVKPEIPPPAATNPGQQQPEITNDDESSVEDHDYRTDDDLYGTDDESSEEEAETPKNQQQPTNNNNNDKDKEQPELQQNKTEDASPSNFVDLLVKILQKINEAGKSTDKGEQKGGGSIDPLQKITRLLALAKKFKMRAANRVIHQKGGSEENESLDERPKYMPASYDWYYIEEKVADDLEQYIKKLFTDSENSIDDAFKRVCKKYTDVYLNDYASDSVMRKYAQTEFNRVLNVLCEAIPDEAAERVLYGHMFCSDPKLNEFDNYVEAFSSSVFEPRNAPRNIEAFTGYARITGKLFSTPVLKLDQIVRNFERIFANANGKHYDQNQESETVDQESEEEPDPNGEETNPDSNAENAEEKNNPDSNAENTEDKNNPDSNAEEKQKLPDGPDGKEPQTKPMEPDPDNKQVKGGAEPTTDGAKEDDTVAATEKEQDNNANPADNPVELDDPEGPGEEDPGEEEEGTTENPSGDGAKKTPDFVDFKYDNQEFKDSYSLWPLSYKWKPAMLKSAYNILDDMFYNSLKNPEFLGDIYASYSDATKSFVKEIYDDLTENESKIKTYIQRYVAMKHETGIRVLTECMNETIAVWALDNNDDECKPKNLAIYTLFLLFFRLSGEDVKSGWRNHQDHEDDEDDEEETETQDHENSEDSDDEEEIDLSIQLAALEFGESFMGGDISVIKNMRKLTNRSPLRDDFNRFFIKYIEFDPEDPEDSNDSNDPEDPENKGGSRSNHTSLNSISGGARLKNNSLNNYKTPRNKTPRNKKNRAKRTRKGRSTK